AVPAAGGRARSRQARGVAVQDAAAGPRQDHRRAALAIGGAERRRAKGWRVHSRTDPRRSLDLALRGHHAEERLIDAARAANPLVLASWSRIAKTRQGGLRYRGAASPCQKGPVGMGTQWVPRYSTARRPTPPA